MPLANVLTDLLRSLRSSYQISVATDAFKAIGIAERTIPQLMFVEAKTPTLNGIAFVRDVRRSAAPYRAAPIIMISAAATVSLIHQARDAGAHEFLRRPFTLGELLKRINAVSGTPRDWIEEAGYIGPDRRRFNSAVGEERPERRGRI